MKRIIAIFAGLLLNSVAAAETQYPIDLSKYREKTPCAPVGNYSPIIVVMYHNSLKEAQKYGEIAFLVTPRDTSAEFLTVWSFRQKGVAGVRKYSETYVHYVLENDAWHYLGTFEMKENMTKKERKRAMEITKRVTDRLRFGNIPRVFDATGFKELWEEAGCTTHGPVPFWWK